MTARTSSTDRNTSSMTVTRVSPTEGVLTRVFDAPRRLVFEAHSKPEHIKRWWGRKEYETIVTEMDFRSGGRWRFVQRRPDGVEYGFRGEFREVVAPERIVQTFEFEGMPGQVAVETMTLTEKEGRTTLTVGSVYPSVEALDAMLQSGMEEGARETWDRLAAYLGTLQGII